MAQPLLTNVEMVRAVPVVGKLVTRNEAFVRMLIGSADRAVRSYIKRKILSTESITEYYSGNNNPQLITRERPIQLVTNIWLDQAGYFGKATSAFPASSVLTQGTDYSPWIDDSDGFSQRGIIQRLGGGGIGGPFGFTFFPGAYYPTKLAGTLMPFWPFGTGNIKITYTAGYVDIPADLSYAATMLVCWMAQNMPSGGPLQSESLGAYSYQRMVTALKGTPELGTLARTLAAYRETTF